MYGHFGGLRNTAVKASVQRMTDRARGKIRDVRLGVAHGSHKIAAVNPAQPRASAVTPREFIVASTLVHGAFFALRFAQFWLDDVVRDHPDTFLRRFIEESTGSFGALLLSWFVYLAWRRAPLRGAQFVARLPAYLGLGALLSLVSTSFMWGTRSLLFPLAQLGAYDYGRMPLRYLMELPGSLIGTALILAGLAFADAVAERRAEVVGRAELERALAESQLRSLRLQLQPHFLFNALNTISSQLHEDPQRADRLLGRLSDLLRASLRASDAATVPLKEELVLLDAYAELMRARFGARLVISVNAAPELDTVPVPPLLIQPLVENAVRHGGLDRDGHACITVTITHGHSLLTIHVHDDGPGLPAGRDPLTSGMGLSTTARRLSLLYGDATTVTAQNVSSGGFAVTITLPALATPAISPPVAAL